MTPSFLCIFGRTPQLAFLELRSIFPDAIRLNDSVCRIGTDQDPKNVINSLGGTVKIAKEIASFPLIDASILGNLLVKLAGSGGRIVFGISRYDRPAAATTRELNAVKDYLHDQGVTARFIESRHGESGLSSVVVAKQEVIDLVIAKDGIGSFAVGRSVAVQPFEQWNRRDYGRPFADPRAGMLPPKVSRMIVNIAAGLAPPTGTTRTLLDPFCGMGTVVAEAALTGWNAVGSDISENVVSRAKKNISWLLGNRKLPKLFVCDATHVSEVLDNESIDAVVTEPYMGETRWGGKDQSKATNDTQKTHIKNTMRGLTKLYIGCLRDWGKLLRKGGVIIIALPKYFVDGQTYFVKRVIDSCENLGYTTVAGPVEYSRPHAVVHREFYIFKKLK